MGRSCPSLHHRKGSHDFRSRQLGLHDLEITYGNWLTHGSQLENDQAHACVRASWMRASPRSTPPTSTRTPWLRRCWARHSRVNDGSRWRSSPRSSVPRVRRANDVGLSRKPHHGVIDGSLSRLQTDYIDLYQGIGTTTSRRSRRQCRPSPTSCGWARSSTSASVNGPPTNSRRCLLAKELGFQLISEPAGVLDALAGHRGGDRADLARARHLPGGWSPIGQGVLTGKYRPGEQPPEACAPRMIAAART